MKKKWIDQLDPVYKMPLLTVKDEKKINRSSWSSLQDATAYSQRWDHQIKFLQSTDEKEMNRSTWSSIQDATAYSQRWEKDE